MELNVTQSVATDYHNIFEWLNSMFLPQFESNFVSAGFESLDKCARLTDGDLVRIGVTQIGYRKRILANLPVIKEVSTPSFNCIGGVSDAGGIYENSYDCDDDENKEIYDIPPPALKKETPNRWPKADSMYINTSGINQIPAPVIPPKKRSSSVAEIERNLGIVVSIIDDPSEEGAKIVSVDSSGYGVRNSPKLCVVRPEKRHPVPLPRDSIDSGSGKSNQLASKLVPPGDEKVAAAAAAAEKPIPKPRRRKSPPSSVSSSQSLNDLSTSVKISSEVASTGSHQSLASSASVKIGLSKKPVDECLSASNDDVANTAVKAEPEPLTKKLSAGLEQELEQFVKLAKKSLLKQQDDAEVANDGNLDSNSGISLNCFASSQKPSSQASSAVCAIECSPMALQTDFVDHFDSFPGESNGKGCEVETEYEVCDVQSSPDSRFSQMNIANGNSLYVCTEGEVSTNSDLLSRINERKSVLTDDATQRALILSQDAHRLQKSTVTASTQPAKREDSIYEVEQHLPEPEDLEYSDYLSPTLPVPPPVPPRPDQLPVPNVNGGSKTITPASCPSGTKVSPIQCQSEDLMSPSAAGFAEALDSYFTQSDGSWMTTNTLDCNDPEKFDLDYLLQPRKQPIESQAPSSSQSAVLADIDYELPVMPTPVATTNPIDKKGSSRLYPLLPDDSDRVVAQTRAADVQTSELDEQGYTIGSFSPEQKTKTVIQSTSAARISDVSQKNLDLQFSGFLSKANVGLRTEMLRRWCVLGKGTLSCYESDKCLVAKDTFDRPEMLSISVCRDVRYANAFELRCLRNSSSLRVALFLAESPGDCTMWTSVLAMTIAAGMDFDAVQQIGEVQYGGIVYARWAASSHSSDWHRTWMHLSEKMINVYSFKSKTLEEVDLRKVKAVRIVQNFADNGSNAAIRGSSVVIDLPAARTLWLQTDIQQETENLHSVLHAAMREGEKSLSSQPLTADDVPIIVEKLVSFVAVHGMETEGVYRLSGQHSKVTHLLKCCEDDIRGVVIRPEEFQIHDVTNTLKRFFRTLQEPILTFKLYPKWIAAAKIKELSGKLQAYKKCIDELPVINRATLQYLVLHLVRVAEKESINKMSTTNLASIFGPCMLKLDDDSQPPTDFGATNMEICVFKDFLENHQFLFEVKAQDLEREKKIQDAMKKIQILNNSSKSDSSASSRGELLIGVHIGNKEDNVVVFQKISPYINSNELVTSVVEKMEKPKSGQKFRWAIFEMLANGELERPLHAFENVLDTTLKWGHWSMELSRDSYLCLKHNSIYDGIEVVCNARDDLYTELHYAPMGKKSFRRHYFEFTKGTIGFRRDARAGISFSWDVLDMVVYVGVQKQRNPPTKYGFSFYSKSEAVVGNYFGHSICCETEAELYQWLAAIFCTQYPDGLSGKPAHPTTNRCLQRASGQSVDESATTFDSVAETTNKVKQFTSKLQKIIRR